MTYFVIGNDFVQRENVKQSLAIRFAIADEGKLGYYSGG